MVCDPSLLAAPWALTLFLLLAGAAMLARRAAANYFASSFADVATIGQPAAICAVCGVAASKKCSRCKSVRYCSQACQSKHWLVHKLKCKQIGSSDVANDVSCENSTGTSRSSGFSSVALVPSSATCRVLRDPKKIPFPYDEFVKLFQWDKPGFPPCGLLNCGNSCYANVVLQCFASTRPLIAYMLEADHNRECILKQDGLCFLCELQTYIRRASESPSTFSPANAISSIDPDLLKDAKQEDAHEFMRLAIEKMQSICLEEYGGEKHMAPSSQETTLIQYIFGGHLLSQVTCTKCNMVSDRYESMMDLMVEIHGEAESLEECLNQFTAMEWLDGDNKYKCDGCNDYVKARKRLTVHQAPNILTIALKRFQNGRFGKLNKRITFPEILNLSPYMSGPTDGTDLYSLYALVVHLDVSNASYYGHYVCYTKDDKGSWYKIDDHKVINVEVKEVLGQGAYMLLYKRVNARKYPFFKHLEPGNKKQSFEPGSIPSSISASADYGRISSNTALQSNFMFTAVEESEQEGTNPATSQPIDVLKEMVSGSMEDVAFKVSSSLLLNEVVDVPNDDNEENLELEKVLEVQNKSPKDECALVSVVLDKLSTAPTRAMDSDSSKVPSFSDFDMEQCNRLLCPSSGCHADEPSGCAETINSNKSQEVSSSDLADGTLDVDVIAPVGRIAPTRKPKPFLSPGFLNAPTRKSSLCVEDLIKEHVVLSPKVNGYSNGHLVPKSADYDPKSNQDMISSSSLFTKDRLPSPPMSSLSSEFGDKLERAAHPSSKTTASASHHQTGCLDDDWLETSILTGQIPFPKKSNGIHEDSNGAGNVINDEQEGYLNSSYSCTGGQLQLMSKLNNQGIINGQMD